MVLGLEKLERVAVRSKVEHLLSLEEILWRQKLRILCIKEGDNSTKFFHKMAISHRYYLGILGVDELIYEEKSVVATQLVQFYKTLYQETKEWRSFVEGLKFDQIGTKREWLERKFEKEEVLQVKRDIEGDRALGSDGFSMAFFSPLLESCGKRCLIHF